MRVLVVSPNHTHPISNGTSKFIVDYCELMRELGHDVYFLHVTYYKIQKKEAEKNRFEINGSMAAWGDHYFHYENSFFDACRQKITIAYRQVFQNWFSKCDDHYPAGLHKFINKLDEKYKFDACIINYFWLSKVFEYIRIPRRAIVTHDSYTYYNMRNNLKMWFNLSPEQEAKALQRCGFIFAMQNEEASVMRYLSPRSKVLVSFCNYEEKAQPLNHSHNLLLFSGGFRMNKFGLEWFDKEIFPAIKREFPDCRLIIGGSICKTIPEYENRQDVEMVGFVDDPADFFKLGDVAINPTYLGAGLKIKTFEAISYGKATMVHPHCTIGIYKKDTAPIFSSDKAEEWVDYLHKIWDNSGELESVQKRDIDYLKSMNQFIRSQFSTFLS